MTLNIEETRKGMENYKDRILQVMIYISRKREPVPPHEEASAIFNVPILEIQAA
jgi:hypothetical protein